MSGNNCKTMAAPVYWRQWHAYQEGTFLVLVSYDGAEPTGARVACDSDTVVQDMMARLRSRPEDMKRWREVAMHYGSFAGKRAGAPMPVEPFMVAIGLGDETTSTASIGRARDHLARARIHITGTPSPQRMLMALPLLCSVLDDVLEIQAGQGLRPAPGAVAGEPDTWATINRERCRLIELDIAGTATTADRAKLAALQSYADEYVHEVAPRPTDELERLERLAGIDPEPGEPSAESESCGCDESRALRAAMKGKFGGVRATERERLERWAKTSGLLGTSTANAQQLIRHIERKLQAEESGRARAAENSCAWHFMREHAGVEDGESVTYDTMARRIRGKLDAFDALKAEHERLERSFKLEMDENTERQALLCETAKSLRDYLP